MKVGDKFALKTIIEVCPSTTINNRCSGCVFRDSGDVATEFPRDPCRVCQNNFIFEKRYELIKEPTHGT